MSNITQDMNALKKKLIIRISVVFLGVMIILTFFSNTINNYSLPRVKIEQPSSGALVKEVNAEGRVEEKETVKLYASSTRKVLDVYVKVGSIVKKGAPIMRLDKEELENALKEAQILLQKTSLSVEKLINTPIQDSLKGYERAIDSAKENISEAEKSLASTKDLYNNGAESKANLDKAQKDYDNAKRNLDQAMEDYETNKQDSLRKSADRERDIKDRQYDLQLQQLKVEKLQKELSSESDITSPCDGTIKEINFEKGSMTNTGTALCTIINTSKGLQFKAIVDNDSAKLLALNDEVEVSLDSANNKNFKGKIVEIKANMENKGEQKDVIVSIPDKGLLGGEPGELRVFKKSKIYNLLIPNSAVGKDDKGEFVYLLKERKGPLGNEYYVRRASISTDDHDNHKTAVLSGISAEEAVVISSSKDSLSDNCRVMPER